MERYRKIMKKKRVLSTGKDVNSTNPALVARTSFTFVSTELSKLAAATTWKV